MSFTEARRRLSHLVDGGTWWPGPTAFARATGAVLTQNTNWDRAWLAQQRLHQCAPQPQRLAGLPLDIIESAIRVAGGFKRKARTIQALARWWLAGDGSQHLSPYRGVDTGNVRAKLLAIHGIGPETADAILAFACDRPVFVADRYAHRLWCRISGHERRYDYDTVAQLWIDEDRDLSADHLRNLHAGIVELAKSRCHKRVPACAGCLLTDVCVTSPWNQRSGDSGL